MRHPRRTHDDYGRPLPSLVDARHEDLSEREANQIQLRALLVHLEKHVRDFLKRGVYAEVCPKVIIQDGVIQKALEVQVTYHYLPAAPAKGSHGSR